MNQPEPRKNNLAGALMAENNKILSLAQGQMLAALADADTSVANLTETFSIVSHHAEQLMHSTAVPPSESFQQRSQLLNEHANQAIVDLQFYDKLTQRMTHVMQLIERLAVLLSDSEQRDNPEAWSELQQQIKSSYTMVAEHKLHDAVMAGISPQQAANQDASSDSENDIELF